MHWLEATAVALRLSHSYETPGSSQIFQAKLLWFIDSGDTKNWEMHGKPYNPNMHKLFEAGHGCFPPPALAQISVGIYSWHWCMLREGTESNGEENNWKINQEYKVFWKTDLFIQKHSARWWSDKVPSVVFLDDGIKYYVYNRRTVFSSDCCICGAVLWMPRTSVCVRVFVWSCGFYD